MEKENKEIFEIENMTCAVCVGVNEKAIRSVKGVKDVTVNLVSNKATLRLNKAQIPRKSIATC